MATFLESSCCRGRRPRNIAGKRHFSRSALVMKLLRNRRVARFVVAPKGFGKSSLVYEYADLLFSFEHVFWLNAASPCFIRDLDAGTLLEGILAVDAQARLIVFDDVPVFDDARAEALAHLIDGLLDRDVEVIAAMVPSADIFSSLQRDRILLKGADLLLDDDEMTLEEAEGRLAAGWERRSDQGARVPCVRWAPNGWKRLLEGLHEEELPADVKLALFAMMVLQEGSLADIEALAVMGRCGEAMEIVAQGYPFVEVEEAQRAFRCSDVDVKDLAEALAGDMRILSAASRCDGPDDLCRWLADALVARGKAMRAVDLMLTFSTRAQGAAWLARGGWGMLARGYAFEFVVLYDRVRRVAGADRERISAQRAWAAYQLGDRDSARIFASRIAESRTCGAIESAMGAAVLARVRGVRPRFDARDAAEALRKTPADVRRACPFEPVELAGIALACTEGVSTGLEAWSASAARLRDETGAFLARKAALAMGAAWVLDDLAGGDDTALSGASGKADGERAHLSLADKARLGVLSDFVCAGADDAALREAAPVAVARAVSALAAIAEGRDAPSCVRAPAQEVRRFADRVVGHLRAQTDSYLLRRADMQRERQDYDQTHPDLFRRSRAEGASAPRKEKPAAPMLSVGLFGGIRIMIEGEPVDPERTKRYKTKMLLALLVLSRGREMSRDRLAESLWPASEIEMARKNLYSAYSQLKRALTVDGRCPYLIRSHRGFRIDERYVDSDVYVFERLCRTLMFGSSDPAGWESVYEQVVNEFSEDLLPSEFDNANVAALRERYRSQLVDGLIAAAVRLGRQGEPRGSLWFAREALRRDAAREDAYVVLMQAQIAADQRGAALETYFACRRFLSDELGIDPSTRLVSLYRSIIESEETLA